MVSTGSSDGSEGFECFGDPQHVAVFDMRRHRRTDELLRLDEVVASRRDCAEQDMCPGRLEDTVVKLSKADDFESASVCIVKVAHPKRR